MNFGQSFRLALKSLTTSKMRSLLTMLGIIIGVASVIVILALGNGVQGMVDEQVEKLGVNMMQTYVWGRGDGSTMDLDPDDMYQLVEEHPDVLTGVSPYVSFQATLRRGDEKFDKTQLYGVSEVMFKNETQATMDGGQKLTAGRFLSFLDVERRNNVCVIGTYLAQEAFQGDALGQTLSINGASYTVIGVLDQLSTGEMLKGGPDDQIYIPYENALELMGARYVTLYIFTSTSGETAAQAKEIIDSMLYDRFQGDTDAYFTQTMEEQANLINAMMGVAIGVLVAIAAIIQVSRIGSMDYASAGSGYEMDAIAAVIVGGTSMSGGKGSIVGTVLGMLIIGVMNNLLTLFGVPPFLREACKGVIVIVAVLLQKKEADA